MRRRTRSAPRSRPCPPSAPATSTVSRVGDTYVVTYIGALAGQPGWDLAPLEAVTGAEFALIGTGSVVLTVDRMTNGRLDYTGFEDMKIELGSARDVLSIQSTHGGRTTVNAGAGSDIVAIEGNDGPTNLNGQAGDDFITVNPVRVSRRDQRASATRSRSTATAARTRRSSTCSTTASRACT